MVAGQAFVLPTPRDRHDRHDKYDKRRSSPHRSSSNKSPSKSSHHSSRHDRSHHHRSSSTTRAYTTDRDASGRRFIHLEPDSHNKVVHLPPPQLGEQYVIIPPPGGKVEVVVCSPVHRLITAHHRAHSPLIRTPKVTRWSTDTNLRRTDHGTKKSSKRLHYSRESLVALVSLVTTAAGQDQNRDQVRIDSDGAATEQ